MQWAYLQTKKIDNQSLPVMAHTTNQPHVWLPKPFSQNRPRLSPALIGYKAEIGHVKLHLRLLLRNQNSLYSILTSESKAPYSIHFVFHRKHTLVDTKHADMP